MIFTTWPFLLFMAVVFVCYWWLVPGRWRKPFLLVCSLAYFTYSYPPYALLLCALTVIVWSIGNLILILRERGAPMKQQKLALGAGIALCVGVLVFFKYTRMAFLTWNAAMQSTQLAGSVDVPSILIPLGISFFTFEFIHYLVDLYLGKVPLRARLLDFGLFAFFFPSLVSGPVKRFQIFQQQSYEVGDFQASYVNDGLRRIVQGVAKKLIVADTASLFTVPLTSPEAASRPMLWLAMYAYAVKIYFDFAGYTDIAIGCAQLLGYQLPENFERPYRQSNIQHFWNKWHMSLSSWLRDYVYIPLGGSKVNRTRTMINLLIVMAICGLWHGANWNFVAWGVWNGLGLVGYQLYMQWLKKRRAQAGSSGATSAADTQSGSGTAHNGSTVVQNGSVTPLAAGVRHNGSAAGAANGVQNGSGTSGTHISNGTGATHNGSGADRAADAARASGRQEPPRSWLHRTLSTALTIQFVCIGWVFFAAPDLSTALLALKRMF